MGTVLCVALNPAIDITYAVSEPLQLGATNRVTSTVRPGGKAINVARIVNALGHQATVVAFVGGATGTELAEHSQRLGIDLVARTVDQSTRRTTTIWNEHDATATVLSEPGPTISAAEWTDMCETAEALMAHADALVCSGSLPPGVPDDAYATLLAGARRRGITTVVDTSGRAFGPALAARPDVVMPNVDEARTFLQQPGATPLHLAQALHDAGAITAIVTDGERGCTAVTNDAALQARGPLVRGNPTGAGDGALGGLLAARLDGAAFPDQLARAVACGAASVASSVAGELGQDPSTVANITIHKFNDH